MCRLCFLPYRFFLSIHSWKFGVSCPLIYGLSALIVRLIMTIVALHLVCVVAISTRSLEMVLARGLFKWFSLLPIIFLLAFMGYGFLVQSDSVIKCRSFVHFGGSFSAFRLSFLRLCGVNALFCQSMVQGSRWSIKMSKNCSFNWPCSDYPFKYAEDVEGGGGFRVQPAVRHQHMLVNHCSYFIVLFYGISSISAFDHMSQMPIV